MNESTLSPDVPAPGDVAPTGGGSMFPALRELWRYRNLLHVLVVRELKARYRGSVLGFFWSMVNPLLNLLIYALVFTYILEQRDPTTSPYVLFLASGLLPWTWISSSILQASSSILDGAAMLKKIVFPAEILPLVYLFSNGVHFVLSLPIYMAFAFYFHLPLHGSLLMLPVVILLQIIFTAGLSFLVASLTVFFRDLRDVVANLLTLWFFSSPVIYSLQMPAIKHSTGLRRLLYLNPMTYILENYHDILFHGIWPNFRHMLMFTGVSLVLFFACYALLHRLRDAFIEEI